MKRIILLVFVALISQDTFAQNFAWAQGWGSIYYDYARAIATDAAGNVFVTGYFRETMDADPGPAVVSFTAGTGSRDIYVSKFNPSGSLVWAKHLAGDSDEVANAIAVDPAGNVYLTGAYQGFVDFDPGPGVFHLDNDYPSNTYICKLDNDGNFIWARQFGNGAVSSYSIAVDAGQNVYTTGRFSAVTDFDPGPGVFNLDAMDYTDMFVTKLNASGGLVWAKQIAEIGDTAVVRSNAIAVDIHGNVYTTGHFYGTTDFDPGTGVFTLTSGGVLDEFGNVDDIFVSKLDADGNFAWAAKMGGADYQEGTAIAVDEDENVYTTGYFMGTVDFDPGPGNLDIVSSGIGANSYISRLDVNGDLVWASSFVCFSAMLAQGIALDQDNNIYTTGYFSGTTDFDLGPASYFLNTNGGFDAYISKCDMNGNFAWAQKFGGVYDELAMAIANDTSTGNVYITGYFADTAEFDPSVASWSLPTKGFWDCFLLKTGECVPQNGITHEMETCNQYVWPENGGLYTESGTYWDILTSSTGCDSVVKLDLTLWNFTNEISLNNFILTSDPNEHPDTVQWVTCDGNYTVVGTEQAYMVQANGSYALITTTGNCKDTTECINVTGLGIDELQAAGFSLYPNPVHDQLTFTYTNALQPFEVEVTSVNGQLIYRGTHASGGQLATAKWKAGIYLVKVTSGEKWYVSKILKD